ncbi:MAG: hypothetical protein HY070_13250 [Chloroflexi bacterium]|nr:hypothetical protein [Chloroflexota bacterium]MBI3742120.1 hypothetical protein [Chloroflexota bacterium]
MPVKTNLKVGMGLGDRLADFTRATGIDRVTNAFSRITGIDCGCEARRQWLNKKFPNF